jgi:Exo-beta-D-glucosaminidase Ig-fold domain/Glycosyl hydrolases family 2/Concanavalin A-like lectin/glucanases superfamily/Glycosyl hydrolases family 2, sugar binding domain/Glycosyl hydrolases family 2, TIM barrel domain
MAMGWNRRIFFYTAPMFVLFSLFTWLPSSALAQLPITNDPPFYGPFNVVLLPDGDGVKKPIAKDESVLRADSPWTLSAWVRVEEPVKAPSLLAGVGDPAEEFPRYLGVDAGKAFLWLGRDNQLSGEAHLDLGKWHFLAATFDGSQFHLFSDGSEIAAGRLELGSVSPILQIGPPSLPAQGWKHFGGKVAAFTVQRNELGADEIRQLFSRSPDFSLIEFEEASQPWYIQTRGQAGYRSPQDPATLPRSKAPFSQPVARAVTRSESALETVNDSEWVLAHDWYLTPAPKVSAEARTISQPGYKTTDWWPATMPGTVLTTMIDRGVYPDPDFGLNNLAIPESLNKQDYWYRLEFRAPKTAAGRRLTLTFQGINYRADVWLNGQSLGTITGAFIRGVFDVTEVLKPGQTNALAVRVSPVPHPGIPQEQSIKGGPGENGGMMCLDGPTFVATEGWDWIPAIRDRNTGIWQPVVLSASGGVKIGDPQVITTLPLPETTRAGVAVTVPLENVTNAVVRGTLSASFDQITVTKELTVAPGKSEIKLTPAEFGQLTVKQPRLWWPNGYGKQELYTLKLSFSTDGRESDSKQVRFGIREISYELSLLDSTGHLRRVEYSPSEAKNREEVVVDITHNGMRSIPAADPPPDDFPQEWKEHWKSWVSSLAPGGENSPSIHALDDTRAAPYLVIKVNGVRIACRGGNWGMDDSRKRVSRERLEPYFRLHHDAHLNIIRNWVGQDTEEVFYDLADEYGLLVWNDFWESTQNYNVEAENPALLLDNARDVILRFRNHPSIVMWCGRNEGVPQPVVNEGLATLIRSLDGTRYYSPSSNQVNLQNSGPYKYMNPALYFTTLNHGFSVETGTPSFSTLEAFKASISPPDQWPISDAWAYHDWHQSGNGDMAPFMAEMQSEFGAPTSLDDFERKAQMLDYVDHRAIFEGMNAHLWVPNSGRMLWMTQPAWPSNTWQILSSDYDTQASFYGVKKACEPLHVQLDLSNNQVAIVNTNAHAETGLSVKADVFSLENKLLLHQEEKKDAPANDLVNAFKLDLAPLLGDTVVLVRLELRDGTGRLLSQNLYWLGAKSTSYRHLNRMPVTSLSTSASSTRDGISMRVQVRLKNTGSVAALATKLTLFTAPEGARILPAYWSDNYVSLLPGESTVIEVEYPTASAASAKVGIRGWNIASQMVAVSAK